MSFKFSPVDQAAIAEFLKWQYEPPYDIYDLDPNDADELERYFLDPDVNCYAIRAKDGKLVGYCTFGLDAQVPGGDYSVAALDIGLGVRPDLTGRGRGLTYVSAVIEFARSKFAPITLRVTVARFNDRALRVWEKAGFRQEQWFERIPDGLPFVVLVRQG